MTEHISLWYPSNRVSTGGAEVWGDRAVAEWPRRRAEYSLGAVAHGARPRERHGDHGGERRAVRAHRAGGYFRAMIAEKSRRVF